MFWFQAVSPKWRVKNRPKIFVPSQRGEKVSNNSFCMQIKTCQWVAVIGYNPKNSAALSLRRGCTSMLRVTGLSDAQIMSAGRRKTLTVMKDYVDWEVDTLRSSWQLAAYALDGLTISALSRSAQDSRTGCINNNLRIHWVQLCE